ncbi:DUF4233 domain-containing protein [Streptacidiphilus sp. MAP5-3]|uniref:DUF4233 domain-containing protein n=1 Tax=unclassified Streptacidiphilus TaxID=2643834 RepID=UPI00351515D6
MRTLCSTTLISEAMVIGFAALVAMHLSDVSSGTLWSVSGAAMALCVLLCGALNRKGAVTVGWALQIALIASGAIVGMMYALGVIFAGLWWCSVHYGRKIDTIKAAREAQADQAAPAAQSATA